jgi:CubicO group peptidase (beta-lactamase class C family)
VFWYYNNWDFNALGSILEQATKTPIFEDFKARIADPLEMEDCRVEDGSYFRGAESIHPAYPFRMTARDMARFGLLYLRGGWWRDRAIVSREWVEESTRSYSEVGQGGGYGYLWWVAPNGGPHFTSAYFKGRVFSARGAGGHYIVVVPYLDLVVVHRVNTDVAGRFVTDAQFGHLMQLILDARR